MNNPLPFHIVSGIVRAFPAVYPYLSEQTRAALKTASGYDGIRYTMQSAVFDAVEGYLSGTGNVTTYKATMAVAISRAYVEAADTAWEESGAELPLDAETAAWARSQLDAQLSFADQLFDTLRELRKDENVFAADEAEARAEAWASGLDGFFNEAVLRGSSNKVAYWRLGTAEKHCNSCLSLDGQGHKISWYIERDYIPRKNGCKLECHGFKCDCRLEDKNGNEITI